MVHILKKKRKVINEPKKGDRAKNGKSLLKHKNDKQVEAKCKYSTMTVDDFMKSAVEDDSDVSDTSINLSLRKKNDIKIQKAQISHKPSDSESDENDDSSSHAKSLNQLKNTDPEFYKFLQENDKNLLEFDLTDEEKSVGDSEEEKDDVHRLSPTELQGASDESDFEDGDDSISDSTRKCITLRMIKNWQEELQKSNVSIGVIGNLVKAFNAALICVSNENTINSSYKVEGSGVFNAVVQLCVLHLQPAVTTFLKITGSSKKPHKCKRWVKIKTLLKGYFADLLKLLGGVTSSNILAVLLKHLHQMHNFLSSFPNISKLILKKLIGIWSTSDETIRVLAFLCILRITRHQQISLLDVVLKTMYMTYVKNCKFISPSSLPAINFMRRSLTEMFALDLNVSYPHVFLYIRQLAIHLRNAITLQKKENVQTVYNWQYISSIHLWADLLSLTCNKPQLQSLIYPLVMIVVNTIKLIPTSQYFPLRFHCLQILADLSKNSGIFIPVLPLILEVLTTFDFNQKHKKVTLKPMQFTCILRVSKSQMIENGFKDVVFNNVYKLLLETLSNEAHSIAFPDLIVPFVVQVKSFIKKCRVTSYCKQMRHILDKVEENARFIENGRSKLVLDLNNTQIINSWETDMKNKGLPLTIYYNEWKKVNDLQKKKKYTNSEEIADFPMPLIKKSKRTVTNGPVELFPSDSEDDETNDFLGTNNQRVEKKPTKRIKKVPKNDSSENEAHDQCNLPDLVENFDISKW